MLDALVQLTEFVRKETKHHEFWEWALAHATGEVGSTLNLALSVWLLINCFLFLDLSCLIYKINVCFKYSLWPLLCCHSVTLRIYIERVSPLHMNEICSKSLVCKFNKVSLGTQITQLAIELCTVIGGLYIYIYIYIYTHTHTYIIFCTNNVYKTNKHKNK